MELATTPRRRTPTPAGQPAPRGDPAAAPGLRLRPPAPTDLPSIAAMWERCTPETRWARFHAPVPRIPASYLNAVFADPVASVVAARERTDAVVALASLFRSDGGDSAELGVLVEDAWQCRGIGRCLVAYLIAAAPRRGITSLTASVLSEHAKVAGLLRRVPGEFALTSHGRTLVVRVRLGGAARAYSPCLPGWLIAPASRS